MWLRRLWIVWCRAIHVFGDNQTHESVIERLEAVSTADELNPTIIHTQRD